MGLVQDAKIKLTEWLTKNSHVDASTEFTSMEALQLQEYYRFLGEEFQLESFSRKADRLATMLLSFKRQSREEAVRSMLASEAKLKKGPEELRPVESKEKP